MNRKTFSIFLCFCFFQSEAHFLSDTSSLCKILKERFAISPFEGGRIVKTDKKTYIISVSIVDIGSSKNEIVLNRIATVKARRNLLVFLEGSEITSSKSLITTDTITSNELKNLENFKEEIKETAIGFVDGTEDLCSWYSDDRKEFIKIIFKEVKK